MFTEVIIRINAPVRDANDDSNYGGYKLHCLRDGTRLKIIEFSLCRKNNDSEWPCGGVRIRIYNAQSSKLARELSSYTDIPYRNFEGCSQD